jgi:hypothetical protein
LLLLLLPAPAMLALLSEGADKLTAAAGAAAGRSEFVVCCAWQLQLQPLLSSDDIW